MTRVRLRIDILSMWIIFLMMGGGCYTNRENISFADQISLVERDLSFQVECGPRIPGSRCHQQIQEWLIANLRKDIWRVETQPFSYADIHGTNIIGKYGNGKELIIFGAHYDTRLTSDNETKPELRSHPVPGANDGASGVALLLSLSRTIPKQLPSDKKTIWLVFFDLEDNGNYPGWDWILGSTAFANSITDIPKAVIVVDMIGDKDLNIFYEYNSSSELNQEIWNTAQQHGYDNFFLPQLKYRMIDDHFPFVQRGFPTSLLIDFDYPYWHTTQDTLDKVSAHSILIVYDTLINWIRDQ